MSRITATLVDQLRVDNSGYQVAGSLFEKAMNSASDALKAKVDYDTGLAVKSLLGINDKQTLLNEAQNVSGKFVDQDVINTLVDSRAKELDANQYRQERDAKADSQWEKQFDFKIGQEATDNEQFNRQFNANRQDANRNFQLSSEKAKAYAEQLALTKNKQNRELELGRVLAQANMPQAVDNALTSPAMYTLEDGRVSERMASIVQSPDVKNAVKGAMDNEGNISQRGWKFIENRFNELGLNKNDFLTYKSQYTNKVGNPVANMRGNLMSQLGGLATPKDIQFADTLLNSVNTTNSPDTQAFQSIVSRESEQNARRNALLPTEEFTALTNSILGDYGGSRNKDAVRILLDAQSRKGDLLTQAEARAIIEAGKNDGLLFDTFSESDSERLVRELFKK